VGAAVLPAQSTGGVYEVLLPAPLVISEERARIMLAQLASDSLLDVKRPGSALVRVRWTPYWFAAGGCVDRATSGPG
jgi:hypothetical protein